MVGTAASAQKWVQDEVAAYRLKQAKLEAWLKRKFPKSTYGRENFKILLVSDSYTFAVPRRLTDAEKDDISDLREEDI
ncbi:hypothetical protein Tdes44962_MAKER01969 [Teratosphaeria destructans]|uniref:Uncharacterized protein n=1 Tax=Teratosphaeria destructans TaxID=418781 RepID=A0A9W7W4A2_9PEZI|nr:hypothetical protein Tdes44962_MAKER01969 [Teratosphaeria destructans]